MSRGLPGLLVLFLGLPLEAAPRKIAVLEFRAPAELSAAERAYLTDLVRAEALRLPPDEAFVMTRENLLALLPPGADLAACEGACEVETGRRVGAELVVSGELLRFGRSLRLALKLHETDAGRLLAAETASGADLEALEGPARRAAAALFAGLSGSVPRRAEPTAEVEPPADVPGAPTVIAGRATPGFDEHLARGRDRVDKLWPADAALSFRKALRLRPDHLGARAGLVEALQLSCILELRQAAGDPPENVRAQCAEALEDARRHLRAHPDGRLHLRNGQILDLLGQRRAAAAEFARYVELTPPDQVEPTVRRHALGHARPGCRQAPGASAWWLLLLGWRRRRG